jgi:acetyl-CoA acetyltransferase
MREPVYVIGVGRTDFKRNAKKENASLRDLIVEAGRHAVESAGIDPASISSGVVGNFAAGRFTRQLHLGALLTDVDQRLVGIPTMHVEAACASGSAAVVVGAQQVMGGLHDAVLVVGAEQQKTMPPGEVGDVLAGAGDYAAERPMYGEYTFPSLFAHVARIYGERFGLTDRQLAAVAVKNRAHATLNPMAQMREAPITLEWAMNVSEKNPMISPPLKASDCSQITDGAAAIVICSKRFYDGLGRRAHRGIRLDGLGHATDRLALAQKDAPVFSVARSAAKKAYDMAGITPADLSGADLHDCFSISEIAASEIVGLAENGQGAKLAATGATALARVRDQVTGGGAVTGKSIPINPGGGLIGDGHPVGATGVRQVVEAFAQLTGTAGDRQIDHPQRYLTFNMGGSLTTSIAMVWSLLA